jgi:hypothetical protein
MTHHHENGHAPNRTAADLASRRHYLARTASDRRRFGGVVGVGESAPFLREDRK